MMYDSTKQTVKFFIRRFRHIIEFEKHKTILRVFSFCLKNDVLKWHNELFFIVQHEMNQNFVIWKDELLKKYRFDRFEFIRKTQKMTFKFEKNTIFSQYFFKKTNTLRNDEIHDETLLIHYFWKNLNAQLILITSIRQNYDIVKSFNRRIKTNETTTKKMHDFFKKNVVRFIINIQISNQYQSRTNNKFVFSTNKVQRLINNYQNQKTTSTIMLSTSTKSNFKKKILFDNVNNKISIIKIRSFRFCRHCDDFYWNKNCSNSSKIIMIQIKKKKKIRRKINIERLR